MADVNEHQGVHLETQAPAAPPPMFGQEHRCAAIPWEVRGRKVFTAFWKTVFLVLAHPARLGELIDQPVSPKEAKAFRETVMMYFLFGTLAAAVTRAALLAETAENMGRKIGPVMIIGLPLIFVFTWLLARLTIGVTRWFFCPPTLTPAQQETSLALSYYLTAPLTLLIFAPAALLLLFSPSRLFPATSLAALAILPLECGAMIYYYVAVLNGLRYIARRTGRNLVVSAFALPLIWLVLWAGVLLLPASIVMWLMMYGSLT